MSRSLSAALIVSIPLAPTYAGTACRKTAWDPITWSGAPWALGNSNLTATSPNNNIKGAINQQWATAAIPDNAKSYYEVRVSGAALYTAFGTGFGEKYWVVGPNNYCTIGQTIANGVAVNVGYNDDVVVITDNYGTPASNVVYGPNENRCGNPNAAPPPVVWQNGDVIGVLADRVNGQFTLTRNGNPIGGTFGIPQMSGKVLYPSIMSWYMSGPVATINGGSLPFAEPVPAGYTALDQINCSGTNNVVTVYQPAPLMAGNAVIMLGKESVSTQQVYLNWRTYGAPLVGAGDWVSATMGPNGTFSAPMLIDHPGTQSVMYYYATTNGAVTTPVTAAWSAVPQTQTQTSATVTQPSPLRAGQDVISGTVSNPTAKIYICWHTYGVPQVGEPDVVPATVSPNGSFSATVTVDHPGTQSSMYYSINGAPFQLAWSATPQ